MTLFWLLTSSYYILVIPPPSLRARISEPQPRTRIWRHLDVQVFCGIWHQRFLVAGSWVTTTDRKVFREAVSLLQLELISGWLITQRPKVSRDPLRHQPNALKVSCEKPCKRKPTAFVDITKLLPARTCLFVSSNLSGFLKNQKFAFINIQEKKIELVLLVLLKRCSPHPRLILLGPALLQPVCLTACPVMKERCQEEVRCHNTKASTMWT